LLAVNDLNVLILSHLRESRRRQLLALGMLLLTLVGMLEPHTGHALSLLDTELEGSRFLPSACHPWRTAHAEAAGPEEIGSPCAACLHSLQSIAVQQAPLPGFATPDPVFTQPVLDTARPHSISAPASSRAPPHRI
jgi:hypothetical protein